MSKRRAAVGVLAALAAPVVWGLFNSATASADTHIVIGGNTDCTSQGMVDVLASQGQLQGAPVPISYGTCDGDFAPWLGSTTPQDAINQATAGARDAWNQNCSDGSRCVIEGFSLGAAPAAIVGNEVGADKPGSNTHVITDGNAWGETGMFGETPGLIGGMAKIFAPVFTGIPVDVPQVPGSENRNNVNDAWGDNAGQNPIGEITQFTAILGVGDVPPQHVIPGGDPNAVFVTDDGVTQESFGQPLPLVVPPQSDPIITEPNGE